MPLILTTESMRVVQKNDRGVVTSRKRYRRGDEVDPELLNPDRIEQLLASGSLVESEDDLSDPNEDVSQASVTAAANFASGGTNVTAPPRASDGSVSEADAGDPSEGDLDEDPNAGGDRYDSMAYQDLQAEAKTRTGNGGGSADDLKQRLRDLDADESA